MTAFPQDHWQINITFLQTEEDSDFVTIANIPEMGQNDVSYSFSGREIPPPVNIFSKSFRIEFSSDESVNYQGFSLSFKVVFRMLPVFCIKRWPPEYEIEYL